LLAICRFPLYSALADVGMWIVVLIRAVWAGQIGPVGLHPLEDVGAKHSESANASPLPSVRFFPVEDPVDRVEFDIPAHTVQLALRPEDVFVVAALPNGGAGGAALCVDPASGRGFERLDDREHGSRQGPSRAHVRLWGRW